MYIKELIKYNKALTLVELLIIIAIIAIVKLIAMPLLVDLAENGTITFTDSKVHCDIHDDKGTKTGNENDDNSIPFL